MLAVKGMPDNESATEKCTLGRGKKKKLFVFEVILKRRWKTFFSFCDKFENFVTSKLLSVGGWFGRFSFVFRSTCATAISRCARYRHDTFDLLSGANFSRESCKRAKQKVFHRKSRVPAKQSEASPKACQQTRLWISKQTFRKLCFDFVIYRRVNLMTQLLLEPRFEFINRFKRL